MAKAWTVTRGDEERSVVVFAETRGEAKASGAIDLEDEFIDVMIKRSPEFDEYASVGKVPVKTLLEHGWWYTCNRCKQPVRKEDWPEDMNPVYVGDDVYHKRCAPDNA